MATTTKQTEAVETGSPARPGEGIGATLVRRKGPAGEADTIACARCDHSYGPADRDPKLGSTVREAGIESLSPLNAYGLTDQIVVRHFHCPGCGLTIAVDIQENGDPVMLGNSLSAAGEEGGQG